MPIGFGIIGCGMIADFHARAIRDLKGAKLVGCFNRTPEKAIRLAENYQCRAYLGLEEMLADPKIEIVTICTPSGAHLESARSAAAAGKHVIVEKPLEITLSRCDAIIQACRKSRVKLGVIFPSRFSPANVALKGALDQGRFGRLTLGDTYVKWWRSQEYYDSGGWRGTWLLDGGGAYMNQAIHNVDMLYWLMGEVTEVTAMTATLAHQRIEVEDVGSAIVRFRNGAIGTIQATTSAWPGLLKRTEIHGTTGTAIVEQDHITCWKFAGKSRQDAAILKKFSPTSATTGGASDPKAISYRGHYLQFQDFVDALRKNREPVIDGSEGRRSVELILAIYHSALTGKRVSLPLKSDPRTH